MLPDWVSNPGPLTYESGALPIALRGPALVAWYVDEKHCLVFSSYKPFCTCCTLYLLRIYKALTRRLMWALNFPLTLFKQI